MCDSIFTEVITTMFSTPRAAIFFGALTSLAFACDQSPASQCSAFVQHDILKRYNTTFLNSTYYPEYSLNVSNSFNDVAFCEVYGSVAYGSNDSLIFAIWLPDGTTYHDRFLAVGGGGMAGTIDYVTMMAKLNEPGLGVAVAGGNSGHLASENNNGSGAPGVYLPYLHSQETVSAWIHNAISLFTPAAKALVESYYDRQPSYSYYYGCSTGGAQGFALAQYHPELFDGIFAGSPGSWYSHLALSFLWNGQKTNTTASTLTQAELNFTTKAALELCDGLDGVKDGLIENPLKCPFDIENLACKDGSAPASANKTVTCLAPSKIAAAKAIYAGPKRSDNGQQLYPGFNVGSEIEWALQEGDLADAFSIPILQNLVFDNLSYNSSFFNWASDVDLVDVRAGTLIDEISNDLTAFRDHGGKLLVSQGWADPLNAATWPIEHLQQVQNRMGKDVDDFFRLFMVGGGGHCGTASYYPQVPAVYHVLPRLISWIEEGQAPQNVLASDPPDGSERTRKLCPWPQTAHYVDGDTDNWGSYVCAE